MYKSKNNSHCLFKTHRKFWLVVWPFSVCLTKFSKQHDERRIGPSAFLWIIKWSLWSKPESTGATPLASKAKSSERLVSPQCDRRRRNARPVVYLSPDQCYFLFISDQNKNDIPFSVSDQTSSGVFYTTWWKGENWLHNNMIWSLQISLQGRNNIIEGL